MLNKKWSLLAVLAATCILLNTMLFQKSSKSLITGITIKKSESRCTDFVKEIIAYTQQTPSSLNGVYERPNITGASLIDNSLHELSLEEPYKSRILGIRERCEQLPYYKYHSKPDFSRFTYDDKHKAIFCVVPKNACSTMKRMMYLLMYDAGTDVGKVPWPYFNTIGSEKSKLQSLSKLPENERQRRLKTYTKFMVQRHPLERLVSAHGDKMLENKEITFRRIAKKLTQDVLHVTHPNFKLWKIGYVHYNTDYITSYAKENLFAKEEEEELRKVILYYRKSSMTFKTFLQSLAIRTSERQKFNTHWRPQIDLCNPCAINYDFIINFESLADDAEKLFSYLQRNDNKTFQEKLHFQKQAKIPTNETKTQKMFKNIDEDLLKEIKRVYEKDFKVFNFDREIL